MEIVKRSTCRTNATPREAMDGSRVIQCQNQHCTQFDPMLAQSISADHAQPTAERPLTSAPTG